MVNMILILEKQDGLLSKIRDKARMFFLTPIYHTRNFNDTNETWKMHKRYTDWEVRNKTVLLHR